MLDWLWVFDQRSSPPPPGVVKLAGVLDSPGVVVAQGGAGGFDSDHLDSDTDDQMDSDSGEVNELDSDQPMASQSDYDTQDNVSHSLQSALYKSNIKDSPTQIQSGWIVAYPDSPPLPRAGRSCRRPGARTGQAQGRDNTKSRSRPRAQGLFLLAPERPPPPA